MSLIKPVHLITNDINIFTTLSHYGFYNDQIIQGIDTDQSRLHYHIYFEYQCHSTGALSPARKNLVSYARRRSGCENCKLRQFNGECQTCGLYYKFIWPRTKEHTQNIKEYIKAKNTKR